MLLSPLFNATATFLALWLKGEEDDEDDDVDRAETDFFEDAAVLVELIGAVDDEAGDEEGRVLCGALSLRVSAVTEEAEGDDLTLSADFALATIDDAGFSTGGVKTSVSEDV